MLDSVCFLSLASQHTPATSVARQGRRSAASSHHPRQLLCRHLTTASVFTRVGKLHQRVFWLNSLLPAKVSQPQIHFQWTPRNFIGWRSSTAAADDSGYVARWTYGLVSRDILEQKSRKLRRAYHVCSTLLAQASWVLLVAIRGLFFVCDLPNATLYNNFL